MTLFIKYMMIKVSVIISCYNYDKYIEQCLMSVLLQKRNFNIEILIGDDGSTDNSLQIIKRIENYYKSIDISFNVFSHPINLGEVRNIEFLLGKSTGEYIAYLDADDFWTDPYKMQKQVDFMDNNLDYSMCITGFIQLNDGGDYIPSSDFSNWLSPLDELDSGNLSIRNNIGSSSRLFRRYDNIVKDYFYEFPYSDWVMNFELSLRGKIKYLDFPSYVYRMHENSLSKNLEDNELWEKRINILKSKMNNKKLLIIASHLSTGGAPQFTLNRIELLKDDFEIMCVEYDFLSPHFVVQRNKIINILGRNFKSLGGNKLELLEIIKNFEPEIIILDELSENFISDEIAEKIYHKDRKYIILETTHSSQDWKDRKKWMPDRFIFVSEYSARMYKDLGIPYDIIEYPIDKKYKDIKSSRERLGFDPEYKHVVNVGLFTSGKNQGYAFELAERLKEFKIKFHFVGNLAGNFQEYWEPLMERKPNNCNIWGERSDVNDFLMASDLFLFTSNFELNPLVVKEALCYDLPQLIFNLDTYCNVYDDINSIDFLTGDAVVDTQKILDILRPVDLFDSVIIDMDGPEFLFGPSSYEPIISLFNFDTRNKLPDFLNHLGLINKGVEIGSFKGEFANIILNKWKGDLYLVDVWRPLPREEYDDSSNHSDHLDAYSETMKNISGFEDRSFMLRMDSKHGSEMFTDGSLDFVYIDANHTYKSVTEDIEYWYPKVKSGGLVMGHDYNPKNLYKNGDKDIPIMGWSTDNPEPKYAGMFGVTPAVNEFVEKNNYELQVTDEFFGTWWITKR